jgi:Tfp pilus assembly protein PilN
MIEINLLPGARKPARGAASVDVREALSGALAQIKDPFLIIAVAGLVLGLGLTAAQYFMVGRRTTAVEERRQVASSDSTRYAAVLAERRLAEAQRDSVVAQFAVIDAIDDQRYVWPHVLTELSRELPQYTWLTVIRQTSPVLSVVQPPPDTGAAARRRSQNVDQIASEAAAIVPKMKLQVIGQTVDIQAVTRYMRLLEASPFIENVNLVTTDVRVIDGGDVTEFRLDMEFQTPAESAIRTVPLTIAVR